MTDPQAIDLVRQLDVELHGEAAARPYSPRDVWNDLLLEVHQLVVFRRGIEEVCERTPKAGRS